MKGLPGREEAASYYYTYIDRITNDDVVAELENQMGEMMKFLHGISEDQSLQRYAGDKWTMREVLNHINDAERVFSFRAFWFARGYDSPLPSMDQNIAIAHSRANDTPWLSHMEEFKEVRMATLALFRQLPEDAWMRTGIASDNRFTVRALAYILAGHVAHHKAILEERYLGTRHSTAKAAL